MKFSPKIFFNFSFIQGLFIFAFSLFLSVGIALQLRVKANQLTLIYGEKTDTSVWQFLLLFFVGTVILLLILKYLKSAKLLRFLFYIAVLDGLVYFAQIYFSWPQSLYFIIFLLFVWFIYRNIFVHNVIMILAVSAISVMLAVNIQPSTAVIILLVLATYDFWAVYKTKHMVQMFHGLESAKVHFAFIIPQSFSGLFKKISVVSPSSEFMFLGTGDIAIPAIFIVTCLQLSLRTATITGLGAICGFIFLHILFTTQEKKSPMPGLPPIVFGCLLGFLIALIF